MSASFVVGARLTDVRGESPSPSPSPSRSLFFLGIVVPSAALVAVVATKGWVSGAVAVAAGIGIAGAWVSGIRLVAAWSLQLVGLAMAGFPASVSSASGVSFAGTTLLTLGLAMHTGNAPGRWLIPSSVMATAAGALAMVPLVWVGEPLESLGFLLPLALGAVLAHLSDRSTVYRFGTLLIAGATVAALLGVYESFVAQTLIVEAPYRAAAGGWPRAAAYTGSSLSLAYWIAAAIALLVHRMASAYRQGYRRHLAALVVVVLAGGLVATWTVGAYVAALGAVLLTQVARREHGKSGGKRLMPSLAVLSIVVATGLVLHSHRSDRFSGTSEVNLARVAAWSETIGESLIEPGGRGFASWERVRGDSPESWYLLVIREAGLVPGLLYTLAAVTAFRPQLRGGGLGPSYVAIGLGAVWIMAPAFPLLGLVFSFCLFYRPTSVHRIANGGGPALSRVTLSPNSAVRGGEGSTNV